MSARDAASAEARPFEAVERVLSRDSGGITTQCRLSAREPFFSGHYPGNPLLPGVFMIEAVHQAVLRFFDDSALRPRLEEVRVARFLSPVRPGDVLQCACRCHPAPDGRSLEIDARCQTRARCAAEIRLLYRLETGDA